MSLSSSEKRAAMEWWLRLPAKRGIDIPAERFDKIQQIANGVTLPIWGRPALPDQLQFLHDNDLTEPGQIHDAFSQLPHPHAPNVTVAQYPDYVAALKEHDDHSH